MREGLDRKDYGGGAPLEGPPPPDHHGRCTVTGTQSRSQTQPESTPTPPHPCPPLASPTLKCPPLAPTHPIPMLGNKAINYKTPL